MALTPIRPGEEPALCELSRGAPSGRQPARAARRHPFRPLGDPARLRERSGRSRARIVSIAAYLIFTSNFDGPLDPYLDELCVKLAAEAQGDLGTVRRLPARGHRAAAEGVPAPQQGRHRVLRGRLSARDGGGGEGRAGRARAADRVRGAGPGDGPGRPSSSVPGGVLMSIDRSDIQGNVLRAYGSSYPCTAYVFAHVSDAGGGRAWLGEVAELVSSDEEWPEEAPLPPERRGDVQRTSRTRGAGDGDRDVLRRVPSGDGGAERDAG